MRNNMGMYDNIRCQFSLPLAGATNLLYQTKDTEEQSLCDYEIREDGTLWCHDWQESKPDMKKVLFDGELNFYTIYYIIEGVLVNASKGGWLEWCACYEHGELKQMKLVRDTPPKVRQGEDTVICP